MSLMDADVEVSSGVREWKADALLVDGVPNLQVEAWFREADSGVKGYITPAEAVVFLRRTSLAKETLSKVSSRSNPTSLQSLN